MRECLAVLAFALGTQASAVEMGDDGLHKAVWTRDAFKDLRDDLAEANAEGRRLPGAFRKDTMLDLLIWVAEQRHESEKDFQAYHSRMIRERRDGATD